MKLITYLQQTHGLARRTITNLIQNCEIILNGKIVDNFLIQVEDGDQYIITPMSISGVVQLKSDVYSHIVLFYKPVGYTVSKSDPYNDTIFDILPTGWKQKYYPIGRLDKDSCGLLLLTDNPARVNQLSHPRYNHQKVYHVKLTKDRNSFDNQKMLTGFEVEDEFGMVFLRCDKIRPINGGVEIVLHEGKNRHIRKMLSQLGYSITELKRITCCNIGIGDLQIGEYRIYQAKSLEGFLHQHSIQKKY